MIQQYGVKYMGSAGHTYEISKIYYASRINIDISRLYQMDIIPMRIFDIITCGGFVLAEYSREFDEIFKIGRDFACKNHMISMRVNHMLNTITPPFLSPPTGKKGRYNT